MKLYLAHPFDSRKYIREWELEFEKRTGIELVNPFYDVVRNDVKKIDAGKCRRYEKVEPKEIVERDLNYIKESNGLVGVITGDLSYGTLMEIVYNKLLGDAIKNHPTYLVVTNGHENHLWLRYHSDNIFTSLKDLEKYLIKNEIHN